MRRNLLIGLAVSFIVIVFCSAKESTKTVIDNATALSGSVLNGLVQKEMYSKKDSQWFDFLNVPNLYAKGWDTLPQPKFWAEIMQLPKDSGVLNIKKNRNIIGVYKVSDWQALSQDVKKEIRDSIRTLYGLDSTEHIYFTTGKEQFYDFGNVLPRIGKAIEIFKKQGVDPFYAQAILLIESPVEARRSQVGAYGYFQLMPRVARKMGLEVSRHYDERKDFDKSAEAAAKLIKTICIPHLDSILDTMNIAYQSTAIWYRLLVLHVYNAGAYNVGRALQTLAPDTGGINLITGLWHTSAAGFRNSSQDYSQVAIASLVSFHKYILKHHTYPIYTCKN